MTGKILIRPSAHLDLDNQAAFIQKDNPHAAVRFLEAAYDAFQLLAQMPELGTACRFNNPKAAGIRSWTIRKFENYLIFYRPTDYGIEVVRVLHAARDITRIFEQGST